MSPEDPFRIALVVVIALTMVVTVYHRLQARSGEKISHREEGYVFTAVLRLAGLLLWIATFGYLFFPHSFAWATLPLPSWLRWCGAISGALCSLLMYWTLGSLGKNLTDTVVTRQDATLVTLGPYRWVRHPFYVTAALLMGSDVAYRELVYRHQQSACPVAAGDPHTERRADADRPVW